MPGIYLNGQYFDGPANYDIGLSEYGLGSDGNATLDGTATFSWATKVGNFYKLTRDVFLDNLTIQNGKTLEVVGFRVFCKTKCTLDSGGIMRASYISSGLEYPSKTIGGSGWGGFGSFYDGRAGQSVSNSLGGNGGAGGASIPGFSPGAGGVATAPAAGLGGWKELHNLVFGHIFGTSQMTMLMGGAGGGGTSGNGVSATGLSGGSGGGVLVLATRVLDINGTAAIQSVGSAGEGDDGGPGDSQVGGGGGGGGGACLIAYQRKTGSGTISVAGGAGGLGGWGYGADGSAGTVLEMEQVFAR